MKKKTLIMLAFISCFLLSFKQQSSKVYVCSNGKVGKYHYSSGCRGLSNCSYAIKAMSISAAKSKGYTLCGWE